MAKKKKQRNAPLSSAAAETAPHPDPLVGAAERFLTLRKKKRYIRKVRNKRKNFIEDWGGALLWAACVVLLINQYFFQAYQIPSGSMESTLKVKDMLFVNKWIYGPECLPGIGKLPGLSQPKRGEIIIFESPEYRSKGVVREIVNRLVYMLSFSLINLDTDPEGNEAVHFLVKRAVGDSGDFISFGENSMHIIPAGCDIASAYPEKQLFSELGAPNHTVYQPLRFRYQNRIASDYYYGINFQKSYTYFTRHPDEPVQRYDLIYSDASDSGDPTIPHGASLLHNPRYLAMRDYFGFYVADGYLLPLGDNRNNSHDARSWGPVHKSRVLGRVSLRYFPFSRFGIPR